MKLMQEGAQREDAAPICATRKAFGEIINIISSDYMCQRAYL